MCARLPVRRAVRPARVSRDGRARVPDGVEARAADLTRSEEAARACADAAVVYHCVQPRYTGWAEEFTALNATIVAAVTEAGAKLVVADNLYMYGPISVWGALTRLRVWTRGSKVESCARPADLEEWFLFWSLCCADRHGDRI
jgi:hypothetical protein